MLSVTPKGLQKLIDAADINYVSRNGLGFNPLKSGCVTYGRSKLEKSKWNIKGESILQLKEVTYLGVTLSSNNFSHSLERVKAGRAALYSFNKSSGHVLMAYQSMTTVSTLFNSLIQPVLNVNL